MEIKVLQVAPIGTNCYIVSENDEAFIVDPGGDSADIIEQVQGKKVKYIFLTHTHYDHIGALNDLKKTFPGALLAVHSSEKEWLYDPKKNLSIGFYIDFAYSGKVDLELKDGDELEFAGHMIKVIHTPGHTPGCVCYHIEDDLFSGDTLFKSSVGRTDLPGGDGISLVKNIKEKLYVLPGKTVIYPGHEGTSTIAWERTRNQFVKM